MFDTTNSQKPTILKDPAAVLDYSFDWSAWLEGEAITTVDVVAEAPLAIEGDPQLEGGVVTVRVSGGDLGFLRSVTCTVTTETKKDARSMFFKIIKR